MADRRYEGPDESEDPVPRDLPDQQSEPEDDEREDPPAEAGNTDDDAAGPDGADAPSPDEAGARRRGEHRSDTVHPEHPDPDESTG
ncbi:hypothetical protein ACQB60_19455 [Actinomycetota bacterium Odt1-20B]